MTESAVVANPAKGRIRKAGAVCLAAGLLGAVASIYLAMISAVGADSFTFPHGAPEFTGLQMVIALLRGGLIFGLLGLWWSGAVPMTRIARFGWYVALVMVAVLMVTVGRDHGRRSAACSASLSYPSKPPVVRLRTPLPWLLGLTKAALLIAAWKSLSWSRTQITATE